MSNFEETDIEVAAFFVFVCLVVLMRKMGRVRFQFFIPEKLHIESMFNMVQQKQ